MPKRDYTYGWRGCYGKEKAKLVLRALGRKTLRYWWKGLGYTVFKKKESPNGILTPYYVRVTEMVDTMYEEHTSYLLARVDHLMAQQTELINTAMKKQKVDHLGKPLAEDSEEEGDLLEYLPQIRKLLERSIPLATHLKAKLLTEDQGEEKQNGSL